MSKKVLRLLGDVDGSVVTSLENLLEAHAEGNGFATEFGEFTASLHGGAAGTDADTVDDDDFVDDEAPVARRGRPAPVADDGFDDDDFDAGNSVDDDDGLGEEDDGLGDDDGLGEEDDGLGEDEGEEGGEDLDFAGDDVDEFDEAPARRQRKPAVAAKPARRTRPEPKPVRGAKPAGRGAKPAGRGAKPVARGAKPAGRKTRR